MKTYEVTFQVTEQDIKCLISIRDQILSCPDKCFLNISELLYLDTVVDNFKNSLEETILSRRTISLPEEEVK